MIVGGMCLLASLVGGIRLLRLPFKNVLLRFVDDQLATMHKPAGCSG